MTRFGSILIVLGISTAISIPPNQAFAGGASSGAIVARPGGGGGGTGGGSGGRGTGGTTGSRGTTGGRGGTQVNPALAADRAEVTTDQAALTTANTTYTTDLTSFTTDYVKKPEYAAAQKGVDDASAALDAQRLVVINKLKASNADYQAAARKETDGRKKLDQMRAAGADRDQISDQAQAILDAGDVVSKLEAAALNADVTYQEIKKKLAAASDVLTTQKNALADAIKADPTLTKDKAAVDTAKTTLATAQAKLAAAGG